ncbi:hypothetical protein PRNP1_006223 [Phytophthora ramorum]
MSSRGSQDAGRASEDKAGDGVYVTKNRSLFSMWLHGKAVPSRTNPAVVFRSADVIQEGYLLKQGLRLKMWTRRYFILRLEERHMTLGYYSSKDSLTLCSETPIGPGHVLGHVNSAKFPRRIELRCGTKVMILDAEDQKSFEAWKNALQEAIRWNHAMVPTKDGSFVTYGKQASEDLKQEERSRAEAAKKLREKQRADEAAAAANAANKPKYLPATRPGTQCFMTSNTRFEIPSTFEYVKTIGSGAYGVVISATDSKTGKTLAVKNIQRAFDDLTDAKRIVREIKLMRHLNHNVDEALAHPYMASIRNVEDETTATSSFDFDFENEKLTKPVLQKLIWDEMRHFHPEVGDEAAASANSGEGENDSFATTQASNTPVTPVTPATAEEDSAATSEITEITATAVEVSTPATEEAKPEDDGDGDQQSATSDQKLDRTSVDVGKLPTDAQTRQEAGEPAREVA